MKKSSKKKLLTAALIPSMVFSATAFSVGGQADAASPTDYKDFHPGDEGYDAVKSLTEQSIFKGFSDHNFLPFSNISREHVAVVLANALKLPIPNNPSEVLSTYTDVNGSSLYSKEIAAVTKAGIFHGSNGKFNPKEPISRSEMATVIVKGFNLLSTETPTDLVDLNQIDISHRNNVQVLAEHGITIGKTNADGKHYFDGNAPVKRVQLAIFLDKAMQQVNQIQDISNSTVKIDGVTYQIDSSLLGLLNDKNKDALIGANIHFEKDANGKIVKINSLQLSQSGNSSVDHSGNLVLDGQGSTIDGDLIIRADYITVKNLTVNGDLVVGQQVEHDLVSDNLTVNGDTNVYSKATQSSYTKGFGLRTLKSVRTIMAQSTGNAITFNNSQLKLLQLNNPGIEIDLKGTTSASNISVASNAVVNADDSTQIDKLTVSGATTNLTLNAQVDNLTINNAGPGFTLEGTGDIKSLNLGDDFTQLGQDIEIKTTGTIESLNVSSVYTNLILDPGTVINNISLPAGVDASDVFTNYDDVKQNIKNIGGQPNPDSGVSTPAPTPTPTPTPTDGGTDQQIPSLSVHLNPGFAIGSTSFFSSLTDPTDTISYKVTDAEIAAPSIGDTSPSGLTPYISGEDITSVSLGKYIQVYELNSNGHISNFGQAKISADKICNYFKFDFYQSVGGENTLSIKFNTPEIENNPTLANITKDELVDYFYRTGEDPVNDLDSSDITSIGWDVTNPELPILNLTMDKSFAVNNTDIFELEFMNQTIVDSNDGYIGGISQMGTTDGNQMLRHMKRLLQGSYIDGATSWLDTLSSDGLIQNYDSFREKLYMGALEADFANVSTIDSLQALIDNVNTEPILDSVAVVGTNELQLGFSENIYYSDLVEGSDIRVLVDGQEVSISDFGSLSKDSATNTITLNLPDGSLNNFNDITISFSSVGVSDMKDVDDNHLGAASYDLSVYNGNSHLSVISDSVFTLAQ